jgi:hypothetical protein
MVAILRAAAASIRPLESTTVKEAEEVCFTISNKNRPFPSPATRIPNPTLPNTARPGYAIAGLDRPRSRTGKAAATLMQSPDQASAPSASDGRCQPAKRTPVANVELMQPATTANHGRQRDYETKSKLKPSEVPMVACLPPF